MDASFASICSLKANEIVEIFLFLRVLPEADYFPHQRVSRDPDLIS